MANMNTSAAAAIVVAPPLLSIPRHCSPLLPLPLPSSSSRPPPLLVVSVASSRRRHSLIGSPSSFAPHRRPRPFVRGSAWAIPSASHLRPTVSAVTASGGGASTDTGAAMKVAVIGGSGNVGSRLARRLSLAGVDVVLASRNPTDEKAVAAVAKVKEGAPGAVSASTFEDAASGADAIIIATPGYATAEEWKPVLAPIAEYAGVVLDASNPLSPWPELNISTDQNTTSATEEIQKVLPKAKVFKAFNTLGAELMSDPVIGGKKVAMLYAGPGDDTSAKDVAEKVIAAVGFEPVLVGPTRAARNLESIAELWIHMAIRYGWNRTGFAFDILKE